MRFMVLMIPGFYETASADAMPTAAEVKAMMAYNAALQKAGVLLSLEGLHPPATGARVSFANGKTPEVRHGPFPETREALGGFWTIDVASQDEASAWAKRCPVAGKAVIEVRRMQEMEDLPADVQQAMAGFIELQKQTQPEHWARARHWHWHWREAGPACRPMQSLVFLPLPLGEGWSEGQRRWSKHAVNTMPNPHQKAPKTGLLNPPAQPAPNTTATQRYQLNSCRRLLHKRYRPI